MTDTVSLSTTGADLPAASGQAFPRLTHAARLFATVVFAAAALVLALVVVGPRFLPYEALVVRSGSMSPAIPTGSVIFYHREAASSIKVGQVIAFVEPGDDAIVITHRVHAIGESASGRYFTTKGDANALPDLWRVPASGNGWVAFFHVPGLGYFLGALSSLWARLALITIPALGLGVLLVLEQRGPPRRKDEAPTP